MFLVVAQPSAGSDRPPADACGYPRRWRGVGTAQSLGCSSDEEIEMSSERNPCLPARRHRHGAKSVAAISPRAVFTTASVVWFRVSGSFIRSSLVAAQPGGFVPRAASFNILGIPEGHAQGCVIARRFTLRCCSLGWRSMAASITFLRSSSLPNQALVPTAHPLARVGARASGAAAAQRSR